nr:hypothetical protein Iba_chr11bCG7080 [Ipomoea batatas]
MMAAQAFHQWRTTARCRGGGITFGDTNRRVVRSGIDGFRDHSEVSPPPHKGGDAVKMQNLHYRGFMNYEPRDL